MRNLPILERQSLGLVLILKIHIADLRQNNKLPFKLLADRQKKVHRLFKVESKLFNLLPGRETYVVNKEGRIQMVFNSINASKHMERALNAVKKLNSK